MAPAPLVAHRFTKEDEDDLVKIWTAKAAILKASAQPPAPRRAAAASAHPVDRLGLWKTHNEDQLPAEMGALKARLGAAEDPSAILDTLDDYLEAKTTAAGSTPTPADVALYEALAPLVKTWGPDERTGELGRPHVVRLVGFVEKNPGLYGLTVPEAEKVAVDPQEEVVLSYRPVDYEKLEKEQKKKEKEVKTGGDRTHADRTQAAAGAVAEKAAEAKLEAVSGDKPQKKKEKKEKAAKPAAAAAAPPPLSPAMIDLRVGHILQAIKHPEADSLYVSTIAMGDAPGTDDTAEHAGQTCRTVCSGLAGLVPLDAMQGRRVVVVANLKPVKMRGVKSCAMVLAASPRADGGPDDGHKGPVELVEPPPGAAAGERLVFDGWPGEPDKVLNPKKKVWEMLQPAFTTTQAAEVAFDAGLVKELGGRQGLGRLVTQSGGVCTVPTLKNAVVR